MELREITNKEEWEGFLKTCAEKTFLHSWNWGEFNQAMGDKIWRFGVYSSGSLIAVILVLKVDAKRGTFLFVPHGPVVAEGLQPIDKKEILQLLLIELKNITVEEGASFFRISPIWPASANYVEVFDELGFREAPIHMHPEITWELDITPTEENLLAGMRKTTRYLIRQAEKNPDIKIVRSNNVADLELFWPVYLQTAKRHSFVVFPKKYLETEFNCFSKDREIILFLGEYKGEVVSAAVFVIWQNICFYHHSGSLSKYNKIPVSYLLQWEAIKEAKNRGCVAYNFWGTAPGVITESDAQKSRHPWAGLSLFKMGFGGCRKEYVKTQDYVISLRYWLSYIIEKMRKRKRNL